MVRATDVRRDRWPITGTNKTSVRDEDLRGALKKTDETKSKWHKTGLNCLYASRVASSRRWVNQHKRGNSSGITTGTISRETLIWLPALLYLHQSCSSLSYVLLPSPPLHKTASLVKAVCLPKGPVRIHIRMGRPYACEQKPNVLLYVYSHTTSYILILNVLMWCALYMASFIDLNIRLPPYMWMFIV